LSEARRAVEGRAALQGNLDPAALLGPPAALRAETLRVLDSFGAGSGHVFNLGHGITPDVDPQRVAELIETVQSYQVS
jgi:uroporphyrinogen decarboxylase